MMRAISRLIIAPIAKKPEVVCLNCKFWKFLQYMNSFMAWFLERNRYFGWQLRNFIQNSKHLHMIRPFDWNKIKGVLWKANSIFR